MRKKIFDDKYNIDNEFYQPTQINLGTAEKDVTEPTETPYPLAKGSDGLPKFNTLQDNQKKKLPKTMRTQVAFQQRALQYNNLQILNFKIESFATGSAPYVGVNYNQATAVGSALNDTIMFSGISGGDNNDAIYYNIVYLNIALTTLLGTPVAEEPSMVQFYPMQKIVGGSSAGGKIPTQISNTAYSSGTTITSSGTEFGVQSFSANVFQDQELFQPLKDIRGIRCIGIALKKIILQFDSNVVTDDLDIEVELGLDLSSGGSSY